MKITVNILTTSRVPIILIFVVINIAVNTVNSLFWFIMSLAILSVVGVTDFLDGYLARKFNVTSRFGAHADPLTDKIFFLATMPTLIYLAALNSTMFHAAIITVLAMTYSIRDQIVTFMRTIGADHKIKADARWYGKARTAISFPAIMIIYYYIQFPKNRIISVFGEASFLQHLNFPTISIHILEFFLVIVTCVTLVMYSRVYYPALKKEFETP